MSPKIKNNSKQQFALFAHPVQHSLSPQIHNYGFEVNRISAVYFVIDSQASGAEIRQQILDLPLAGCNLSLPLKETLLPYLDQISPTAQLIGAVNTVKNSAGHLFGDNTDGTGFVSDLQAQGVDLPRARVLLLGGGATARAILVALSHAGTLQVTVAQRAGHPHYQQIQQIMMQLADPNLHELDWSALTTLDFTNVDVVINATSIGFGQNKNATPLQRDQLKKLPSTTKVWDVIYEPRQTPLLQLSQQLGLETHNGLGMLVQQAAGSFKIWTAKTLPIKAIETFLK